MCAFHRFFGWLCLHLNNEKGRGEAERRHERSRGGCWGVVDVVCNASASSAQLKRSEMSENGGF